MYCYLFQTVIFSACLIAVRTEYENLVNSEVWVELDNLTVYGGRNLSNAADNCTFTLHRTKCADPPIEPYETIAWNTRLCFQWHCDISEHAIRVESCWVGSKYNPMYLITSDGCSSDTTMINSPRYERGLQRATSLGWLTVRQVGFMYLRLKCHIQLCHVCDDECSTITPPQNCKDYSESYHQHREVIFWNSSTAFNRICDVTDSSGNDFIPLSCPLFFTIIFAAASLWLRDL